MSKNSDIRKIVKSYNGYDFTTSQVRKDMNMYKHTYQRLQYLESLREIQRIEVTKTGGRSTITWREVKINESLIDRAIKPQIDVFQSSNPWAAIWPEFFMLPKLNGTLHSY